ncbi:hypothetical protein BH23GEM8_BH23GEM8_02670 [soil metagenome]
MRYPKAIGSLLMTTLLAGASASSLVGQAARESSFVILMGSDTFAVESFSRDIGGLAGEISGPSLGRMHYSYTAGAGGTLPRMTLRAWMPGVSPEQAPSQEARLSLEGGSVTAIVSSPAGERSQTFESTPGAVLYLNPSFAVMEQVAAAASSIEGEMVEVPIFMVQGGQTVRALVRRTAHDSITIELGSATTHAQIDASGRILSATVPAQRIRVVRVDGRVSPITLRAPDYSAPPGASYRAEDVTVRAPAGHSLAGTLTRPLVGERVPAVIMITGSGAQDRDQAAPIISGYRPFMEIADALSGRGVAVLRLDDRGFGASTGDFPSATSADFADDVLAAVEFLRARDDIDGDRIGLIGHSEGGLIAPLVAMSDSGLRGIVLIGAPAHTGRQIIHYQQRYAIEASPAIRPEARDSATAALRAQLEELADGGRWLRFFLEHDPLAVARRVRQTPVLILHGATDRQVTADQAVILGEAFRLAGNPDVTTHIFPGVNHLMLADPDGTPAGYSTLPSRTLDRRVMEVLVDWVVARAR